MNHYIYKTTNNRTGEYYYGKRSSLDWKNDPYLGSGILLKRKMAAHPEDTWTKEVLLLLDSSEEAYEYEKVVVGDKWRTDPLCLNLQAGGVGGCLSVSQLEERKARRLSWETKGELPTEVGGFSMSNDSLGVYITLTNDTENTPSHVKELIDLGYDFGANSAYTRVTLTEVGLANCQPLTHEEKLNCLRRGEFPNLTELCVCNHELEVYSKFTNHRDSVKRILELLSKGWVFGRRAGYKKISPLAANGEDHESRFLSGLPPHTKKATMSSPCKSKYVVLKLNAGRYTKSVSFFYSLGWRFGGQPANQTKVSAKEEMKRLTPKKALKSINRK